jgi:putative transcriptional regulator
MIGIEKQLSRASRGCLDGHFLIAMPGMSDERFERTVIFVCAHSADGAMGFILNRPQPLQFHELLANLDLATPEPRGEEPVASGEVSESAMDFPIQIGGPVEAGRGFVLHSDDYMGESTMPVNDDLCLTATIDILRAIKDGRGPKRGHDAARLCRLGAGATRGRDCGQRMAELPGSDDIVFDRGSFRKI